MKTHRFQFVQIGQPTHHFTKYRVFEIEMLAVLEGNKELRGITIGSAICHAQNSSAVVGQAIFEFITKGSVKSTLTATSCAYQRENDMKYIQSSYSKFW